ncbi:hypothetical protein Tco_0302399, partial [Tanacetum coccineum]
SNIRIRTHGGEGDVDGGKGRRQKELAKDFQVTIADATCRAFIPLNNDNCDKKNWLISTHL